MQDRSDLSKLYPNAKSFTELEVEREQREAIRKPRFVAIKIGAWATLSVVIVFIAYRCVMSLMANNSSFSGEVLANVSFSLLISLFAVALVVYLYSLSNKLLASVLISVPAVYTVSLFFSITALVLLTTFAATKDSNLLINFSVILAHFLAICGTVNILIRR